MHIILQKSEVTLLSFAGKFSRLKRFLRKRRKEVSILLSLLFVFFSFAIPIRLYIEKRSAPLVISSVEISARAQITKKIGDTVIELLSNEKYCDMLSSPSLGQKEAKVNGTLLSLFVSELNLLLSNSLSSMTIKTEIPLGSILFPSSLSGRGRLISIKSACTASAICEVKSSIESAGFNQSLHTLTLVTSVKAVIFSFGERRDTDLVINTLLFETLTVGKDPDSIITS